MSDMPELPTSKHQNIQDFYDYLARLLLQRKAEGWEYPYNVHPCYTKKKSKTKRMEGF